MDLTLKAQCVVITAANNINHMTLVNPEDKTVQALSQLDAWTTIDSLTVIDQNSEGTREKLTIANQWFLDTIRANSPANVWLVRFVSRARLGIKTLGEMGIADPTVRTGDVQ